MNEVEAILDKYQRDSSQLVSILQDVQEEYSWLPKEALTQVSKGLRIPLSRVFSVASFFKAFSLVPKGRHTVTICMGTACHVRGSLHILDRARQLFNIEPGGTTSDLKFTLESVNCLGCCALGPIMVVDGEYHGRVTTSDVGKILESCD